ncbi:hypothetical protein GCM10010919_07250 [Alishewanella longhuensis]|uniref:DUF2970 domain-containing protein n=1 Tax=Alishewanella longhuensis TaxID=1091037 RepID=A0ABQ3KWK3_9ALTE|nr:DUF2970 domain-containing protein [Alishewanella longhuensis]GHG62168.1 hypothetical protein GCM10010919_07250 [Alishewanella longhuensis]
MSAKQASFWQIVKAVFGAFIGVQSEKQRLQDFQSQSALPYVVTAVIFAAIFVASLFLVVSIVLS